MIFSDGDHKQICILARPKENIDWRIAQTTIQIERLTGRYCVMYLKIEFTIPEIRCWEEGNSFVWENHQVYMPFLGLMLSQNEIREISPCFKISFYAKIFIYGSLWRMG